MRRLAVLTVLLALALGGVARADGDPASDVLLSQDSYLPYSPPTQKTLKTALETVLKAARSAGYPMKVALIATEADLGAYPQLFNQPQKYADLLTQELGSLNPHGDPQKAVHLLVVMPGGYGGSNLGDGVDRALSAVEVPSGAGSDGLARAALAAVARIATENGHSVPVPPEASAKLGPTAKTKKSGGGGPSFVVFLAPALLLFAGLFVAGRVSARRARDDAA
jgi:hypothetical protein